MHKQVDAPRLQSVQNAALRLVTGTGGIVDSAESDQKVLPCIIKLLLNTFKTPTTSRRFSSYFVGCQYDNASLSSWRHWFTSA